MGGPLFRLDRFRKDPIKVCEVSDMLNGMPINQR